MTTRLSTYAVANGHFVKAEVSPGALLGDSSVMQDVKKQIERVAATTATVLITGESGSGKELVARIIHESSPRRAGPFIAINCAAIPESLIEAELFGHEKGSFTGAVKSHQGVFERARGGTLLLDEISEMSIAVQSRLLRVLQNYRFYRVGGSEEMSTDVRIIAATNCNLVAAVHAHEFRADLLYRLAVFPIKVPPLRARGDDIILLASHFLAQLNAASGEQKRFVPGTEEFLRAHDWPGNVRELRNCIERAFIMCDDVVALDSSLLMPLAGSTADDEACIPVRIGSRLADVERQLIVATLDRFGGNKRHAAEVLGCSVKTLYNKLHLYQAADGNGCPQAAMS
jgi:DNA-binding NtrC family response regulator